MKTMRLLMLVLVLLGSSVANPVRAEAVSGLYEATASVPSMAESDRTGGFVAALRQVIMKASGQRALAQSADPRLLAQRAEGMVQSYRYETLPDGQIQMRASFNPIGVERLLGELGSRLWSANRPRIVVWSAVDSGQQRALTTQAADEWSAAWLAAASERGVPVYLPRFDAQEQSRVTLSDVWGQFMDSLTSASQPYAADVVAAVRVAGAGNGWSASWRLSGALAGEQGQSQGDSPRALASAILDAWSQRLVERYAGAASQARSGGVDLDIEGLTTLEDYIAVRQAVSAIELLSDAMPVQALPGKLVFRSGGGAPETLREHLALDKRFQFVAIGTSDATSDGMSGGVSDTPGQVAEKVPSGQVANAPSDTDTPAAIPVLRYRWNNKAAPRR